MALNLPRLQRLVSIVDKAGQPALAFHRWWDSVATAIENQVLDLLALIARVTTTEADLAALTARNLTAGAGLVGGGDLSADRTFDIGAGAGIAVAADSVALDTTSTRNTDHAGVSLAAGAGLTGGGDITASRSFAVGAGTGITVNADDVALDTTNTRNVDHASVSILAGTGLSGGGDLTASRTLNLANTAVGAGSYGSATSIPTITFDAQGRATAASGNTIPVLASGTYTPTLTNTTNVTSSTAYSCQYLRVGNTVTVSGKIDIFPTAAGQCVIGMSLPIASNLANENECAGAGGPNTSGTSGFNAMAIKGDATNDRATIVIAVSNTAGTGWFFTFSYRVI